MANIPKTLRQISGLSDVPANLADSVLIIVDAQKEYTQGSLRLAGIEQSVDALARFLARARAAGAAVIHVIQIGKSGGAIMNPDGKFVEIIDELTPIAGEIVVKKHLPSSFTATELAEELERIGRKDLIVTGYMTHMCLNSTVRDAAEAGYRCTIAADLTTTRDLPDGAGGVIPADVVKAVNLASLADRFAMVVPSADQIV